MPGGTRPVLGNVLYGQHLYLPAVTYPTLATNASGTNTASVPGLIPGQLLIPQIQAPPAHLFLQNAYVSAPGVVTFGWDTDATGISTGSVAILLRVEGAENLSNGISTLPSSLT